jgi:hypothetical protein
MLTALFFTTDKASTKYTSQILARFIPEFRVLRHIRIIFTEQNFLLYTRFTCMSKKTYIFEAFFISY